jgi:hypothetical protein
MQVYQISHSTAQNLAHYQFYVCGSVLNTFKQNL